MTFAQPWFLLLLIPLAALGWMRWSGSRFQVRLPFPTTDVFRSLGSTWRSQFRWAPDVALYVGLVCAIIALARPQSIEKGEEARAKGIDIMLVLDTSESMRALDFDPLDRMAAAKRAAKNFVQKRQFDRIGLVVFSGVSFLACPLTLDYPALLEFLDQVDVGITGTQNTAIGSGIASGANHLKKSQAKSKIMILLTDGRSNAGEVDPMTAAKAAHALGIKIYVIGVGIRGESKIPVQDPVWGKRLATIQEDLDEPTLRDIAALTEGQYYRATSSKELDSIYGEIDKLEKTDVKGPAPQSRRDHYWVWLMVAMGLVSSSLLLRKTLWRQLP